MKIDDIPILGRLSPLISRMYPWRNVSDHMLSARRLQAKRQIAEFDLSLHRHDDRIGWIPEFCKAAQALLPGGDRACFYIDKIRVYKDLRILHFPNGTSHYKKAVVLDKCIYFTEEGFDEPRTRFEEISHGLKVFNGQKWQPYLCHIQIHEAYSKTKWFSQEKSGHREGLLTWLANRRSHCKLLEGTDRPFCDCLNEHGWPDIYH
jgi:hypothetical protein